MESTTTTWAPEAAAVASMASTRTSGSSRTCPAPPPSRSARRRTCSADSSPETYNVGMPASSRRAAHCSSSVDLPIPGSPPTMVSDPGTRPPPTTKSISLRPVFQRRSPSLGISASRRGVPATASGPRLPRRLRGLVRGASSSATVFQAPHPSHRPTHLGYSAPHSVQRYTERLEGIRGALALALGVVVEPGVLLVEGQLDGAGGPVAVLGQMDFRHPLLRALVAVLKGGVHLRPVNENHQVGVLLDGAGIPQVGEQGPPVATPLFRGPRQLGERDDRRLELPGQRFQRAGDEADLLLAAVRVRGPAQQLQVVHHEQPDVVLRLEPPGLGTELEQAERGAVVDPDGGGAQQARGARHLGIVIVPEVPAPQALQIH